MTTRRAPVSIICVFNDPVVRQRCLDRSIDELRHEAPDVEYLPVNNVNGTFSTAGDALNHGAAMASHDYVVFVHQDVYLHSLAALEEAAGVLAGDDGFGVLGAFGFSENARLTGFIRDRVVLLGVPVRHPTDVDSLDEVLFMAPRSLVQTRPLSDAPDLAWHAYAVEYGLRARVQGLRVGVANIPLTHNSLTVNLDRLDVAHRAVAAAYPEQLPVHTTCGLITAADPTHRKRVLPAHRWRYRWIKGSLAAHSARRAAGGGPFVLSDIRLDIDDVIASVPEPLRVFNVDQTGSFVEGRPAPLELFRRDRNVLMSSGGLLQLTDHLRRSDSSGAMLLTNLDVGALRMLAPHLVDKKHVVGYHQDFGCWVLLAPDLVAVPSQWRSRAATPLGMQAMA